MREKLETLSLTTLKDLAKQKGIKGISGLRKAEIIDLLCEQEEKGKQEKETAAPAPAKQLIFSNDMLLSHYFVQCPGTEPGCQGGLFFHGIFSHIIK